MRKARVFGQLLGVQGMVIEEVTVEVDPDGDGEVSGGGVDAGTSGKASAGGTCNTSSRSMFCAGVHPARWSCTPPPARSIVPPRWINGGLAVDQWRGAGSCFAVIELRHEFLFAVRAAARSSSRAAS